MKLNIQIKSFVVSFLFGIFFYFLLEFFNKLVIRRQIVSKIILSFLFIFLMAILYFILLLFVNNGFLHMYFLLSILVGYKFISFLIKIWLTHIHKKY